MISPEYYAYYDLLYGDRRVDLAAWRNLANKTSGAILDVGCGTGRVLSSLAPLGRSLTGIDISAEAVRRARAKLPLPHISVVQADMRAFDLPGRDFGLALLIHNAFLHCLSSEAQLACLRSIRRHLRLRGTIVIDVSTQPMSGGSHPLHLGRDLVAPDGARLQWYLSASTHPGSQMSFCRQLVDRTGRDGAVHRAVITFVLRFVHRRELEALLHETGFEVEAVYGDYEFAPLGTESQKMITVARAVDT